MAITTGLAGQQQARSARRRPRQSITYALGGCAPSCPDRCGVPHDAGVGMQEVHGHTIRIAPPAPAGKDRRLPMSGTDGPQTALPAHQACEAVPSAGIARVGYWEWHLKPASLPRMPPEAPSRDRDRLLRSSRRPSISIPSGAAVRQGTRSWQRWPGITEWTLVGPLDPGFGGRAGTQWKWMTGSARGETPSPEQCLEASDDRPSGRGEATYHTRT
jgi:hypothetical protein